MADLLHGRLIVSKIPHGVVSKVDVSRALSIDGVKAVVTCFDDKTIWHSGEREHERRLFTDRVRFVGDCVGAVAASDRRAAERAVEAVSVEYEELPTAFTIQDAMKPGAPRIWEDGNLIGPLSFSFGDLGAASAKGDLVLEREYETQRVQDAPLEVGTSLAWWEGDKLTVVAGTQGTFGCRDGLSLDLGVPAENIRVITHYKGGGFGAGLAVLNLDLAAALLAKKAGRPVRMETTRTEDLSGSHGRWSSVQRMRGIARKRDGKLLAVDFDALCDIGAYHRGFKMGRLVQGAETYYDCEAWKSDVRGVYTNTPATGPMRAPPGPQACFASETLIDEIAHELKINPVEIRMRNGVVRLHNGAERLTTNGLKQCLTLGARAIGWDERWNSPPQSAGKGGVVRGLGVAMAAWHAWLGRGEAAVKLLSDETVELSTGVIDIGTGAKTTMAMIVSKVLKIPADAMKMVWGDTMQTPFSRGEGGSTTTAMAGTAMREAAGRVKTRLLELASKGASARQDLDLAEGGLVVSRDGRFRARIADLMEAAGTTVIEERAQTEPVLPEGVDRLSFGAHFVEVTVDTETGEVRVSRYVAAHDSGEIVNHLTAESQVQGGVVMGLGMALSERVLISPDDGSMQNSSFYGYRIPSMMAIPRVESIFVETDDPYGPKSLGEVPVVPVAPAVGNAIFNATGARLRRLPFTPERVLEAIEALSR